MVDFTSELNALAGPRPSGVLAKPWRYLRELVADISAIFPGIGPLDRHPFSFSDVLLMEIKGHPRQSDDTKLRIRVTP